MGPVRAIRMHGENYSKALLATISFLQSRTTLVEINKRGQTLLHIAVESGNEPLIRHAVQTDAIEHINRPSVGLYPLDIAIRQQNKTVFDLLMSRSKLRPTFEHLLMCAKECSCDIYFAEKLLDEAYADPANHGMHPRNNFPSILYTSIVYKNFPLAKFLMARSHNINDRIRFFHNARFETVFSLILSEGPDMDVLDFVLELSGKDEADFLVSPRFCGCILHALCENRTNPIDAGLNIQILDRVLRKYRTSQHVNFMGQGIGMHPAGAPLHAAVSKANFEAAQALLNVGADDTLVNMDGQSPLGLADQLLRSNSIFDIADAVEISPSQVESRLAAIRLILSSSKMIPRTSLPIGLEWNEGLSHAKMFVDEKCSTLSSKNSTLVPAESNIRGVSGKGDGIKEYFEERIAKSSEWWNLAKKAQFIHVRLPRDKSELALVQYFAEYLRSADDEDLPRLPDGEKFPQRPWQILRDYLVAKGLELAEGEMKILREQDEDHPMIKEWLSKKYEWWEEWFGADRMAESLCRYSPYRWEVNL
ncbi:MAG: hypothetical protein LQ342_002463 [Letrouitia transgressa]|nr:MAG: hypothetical protein LQ342_002463 [Letrouitia transgressa]